MPKYYFTFGSSGQVYKGGWVEIHAINMTDAQQKFEKRYGNEARNKETGLLRYSDHYREDLFRASGMIETGNLGAYCHEVIYS